MQFVQKAEEIRIKTEDQVFCQRDPLISLGVADRKRVS